MFCLQYIFMALYNLRKGHHFIYPNFLKLFRNYLACFICHEIMFHAFKCFNIMGNSR